MSYSIYGLILEIIIGGKLAYFYLFTGPALVIYGSMLVAFAPKEYKIFEIIIVLVVMFIFMIAGAIIGDTSYTMVGKPYFFFQIK